MRKNICLMKFFALLMSVLTYYTGDAMAIKQSDPLANAVMDRNFVRFVELLKTGTSPEQSDHTGTQSILLAGGTDQFRMVEILMNYGASIWIDDVGATIGGFAYVSRLKPESTEGQALARVIPRLIAAGYPWPVPGSGDILKMKEDGKWPPANAKDVFGHAIKR